MIRVISSPSSSTTGFCTLIFATGRAPGLVRVDEVVRVSAGLRSRPRPCTASRSSASSATEASMRAREKSSISRPWTISHLPPRESTGNEEMRPSGTPYEPSDDDRRRGPVAVGGAVDPAVDVVDGGVRGRRGRRRAARLDDRRAALGDGRDEVVLEPRLVVDDLGGGLAVDRGVEDVGVLRRRVVAPDRQRAGCRSTGVAGLLGRAGCSAAVVVEPGHRGEPLAGHVRRVRPRR